MKILFLWEKQLAAQHNELKLKAVAAVCYKLISIKAVCYTEVSLRCGRSHGKNCWHLSWCISMIDNDMLFIYRICAVLKWQQCQCHYTLWKTEWNIHQSLCYKNKAYLNFLEIGIYCIFQSMKYAIYMFHDNEKKWHLDFETLTQAVLKSQK